MQTPVCVIKSFDYQLFYSVIFGGQFVLLVIKDILYAVVRCQERKHEI